MLEPASGTFDVTVAAGEDVQAAVDRCPPGGCVLLLPGTHAGPVVLTADKVVHVFGRGRATLQTSAGEVVISQASKATLDGILIQRMAGNTSNKDYAVWIVHGGLRMQACEITCAALACVCIDGGADPVLAACKCVLGRTRLFLLGIGNKMKGGAAGGLFHPPSLNALYSLGLNMPPSSPPLGAQGPRRSERRRHHPRS